MAIVAPADGTFKVENHAPVPPSTAPVQRVPTVYLRVVCPRAVPRPCRAVSSPCSLSPVAEYTHRLPSQRGNFRQWQFGRLRNLLSAKAHTKHISRCGDGFVVFAFSFAFLTGNLVYVPLVK